MQIFDRIDPGKLEQRDTQLWMLAITMLVVMATGIALLIYPAAFSTPVTLSGTSIRRIFISFCVLSILLAGYLTERHLLIHNLRKQLLEERTRSASLLMQASAALLDSLPGYEQFEDRLALDFSRAVSFQQPLSMVIAYLKASAQLTDVGETSTAFVDAAKAMIRKLRGQDSIFLLTPGVFGILLPGVFGDDATRVAARLSEGLTDAAGAHNRFSFELRALNYPRDAATVQEMEKFAQSCLAKVESEAQRV